MIRRSLDAVVAAYSFDTERRELFVEGGRDESFVRWLVGDAKVAGARIVPIDAVDVPGVDRGGNRLRIFRLAEAVASRGVGIRYFADRDDDALLGVQRPSNGWLTDCRDLESYVLRSDCVDKFCALALRREPGALRLLLEDVMRIGRTLACLRLVSARRELDLPFRRTSLRRSIRGAGGRLEYDSERHVITLLQNCGRSVGEAATLLAALGEIEAELAAVAPCDLVHGKDAIELFQTALGNDVDFESGIWATYERGMAAGEPNLTAVVAFLSGS